MVIASSTLSLRFIGHASIEVLTPQGSLLCDPWQSGRVFNNSWALSTPPIPVDYGSVNWIWISHEHPDHLHFPTLRAIPIEDKKRMTILFQKQLNPRIIQAFHQLGFQRILEMDPYRWISLGEELRVLCGTVGYIDSFLALEYQGKKILNLNDCLLDSDHLHAVKRQLGSIDVLLTQFSFASWIGNEGDEVNAVAKRLQQIQERNQILQPRHLIPFASFVYFCNQENAHMNRSVAPLEQIQSLPIPQMRFMYPGDCWDAATDQFQGTTPIEAIRRYSEDFTRQVIDPTPDPVPIDAIEPDIQTSLQEFLQYFPAATRRRLSPFSFYLKDLGKVLTLDPNQGTHRWEDADGEQPPRFELCSQAVWFLFHYPWGADTTLISGMFKDHEFHRHQCFPDYFSLRSMLYTRPFELQGLSSLWQQAVYLWMRRGDLSLVSWPKLKRKIRKRLGL